MIAGARPTSRRMRVLNSGSSLWPRARREIGAVAPPGGGERHGAEEVPSAEARVDPHRASEARRRVFMARIPHRQVAERQIGLEGQRIKGAETKGAIGKRARALHIVDDRMGVRSEIEDRRRGALERGRVTHRVEALGALVAKQAGDEAGDRQRLGVLAAARERGGGVGQRGAAD